MATGFLVCPPEREYSRFSDPGAHNIEEKASESEAKRQHEILRKTLLADGCRVIELRELEGHPNSVFTRDPAFVLSEGYIKMRMGLESRKGEENWIAEKLGSIGIVRIGRVEHGTAEGGDLIKTENTVFIGISSRTNREGAAEIAGLLKDAGYDVRTAEVPEGYLHLGGAVSYLGKELMLCTSKVYDKNLFRGFDVVVVDDPGFTSGNVIKTESAVLVEKRNSAAIELLEKTGIKVISLDLSEFIKGRGGPSCLVLPVD